MRGFFFLLFSLVSVIDVLSQKLFIADFASDADFKVIIVEQPSQADLKVYREKIVSQAKGNRGFWYFTKIRSEANKKILFVKYLSEADLKIYFVDYKSQAGWINEKKKYILEKIED